MAIGLCMEQCAAGLRMFNAGAGATAATMAADRRRLRRFCRDFGRRDTGKLSRQFLSEGTCTRSIFAATSSASRLGRPRQSSSAP